MYVCMSVYTCGKTQASCSIVLYLIFETRSLTGAEIPTWKDLVHHGWKPEAGTFTSQQAEKQRNGEFQCLLTFLLFLVCYIQNPSPIWMPTFRLFLLPIANPVWMVWQACLSNSQVILNSDKLTWTLTITLNINLFYLLILLCLFYLLSNVLICSIQSHNLIYFWWPDLLCPVF